MPAENAGVCCGIHATQTGRGKRVRVSWQTNSSGVFRMALGMFVGTLLSEETTHATSSATGTIAVTLINEASKDYLDSQHGSQAVNTTQRLGTVDNELRTAMESRPVRINSLAWLVITASTSAVHYGTTEFEIEEDR